MGGALNEVFGLVRVMPDAVPIETRIAGVPLLVRAVLVLKNAGISPIRVLARTQDVPRVRSLLRTRALDEQVEIVTALPNGATELVELPHDVVCDPAWIRARLGARAEVANAYFEHIDGPAAMARATRALFEACRKPVDGLVSRHLNRSISLFISKRIVDTPISPNLVSVITLGVGLSAAAAVAKGGYGWTLLGAFLLQCNSILDGVDGELARVRFQHSHLGQWLDTLSDDIVNVVFWIALGLGAQALPYGRILMETGLIAGAANFVLAMTYWIELVAIGSGDGYAIDWGRRGPLIDALMLVAKKDFFILFCFGCAVFGVLAYALPLIAAAVLCSALAAILRGTSRLVRAPSGAAR